MAQEAAPAELERKRQSADTADAEVDEPAAKRRVRFSEPGASAPASHGSEDADSGSDDEGNPPPPRRGPGHTCTAVTGR